MYLHLVVRVLFCLSLFFAGNPGISKKVVFGFLSVLCLCLFSAFTNDVFDAEIDRENKKKAVISGKKAAVVCVMLAVLCMVFFPDFYIFSALALSFLYSAPPVRLRNYFSTVWLGIGCSLIYTAGTGSFNALSLVVFLAVALGTNIKDLKDYKGDKKNKVKNVFTVFGPKTGRKISLALLFAGFMCPLIVFNSITDIVIFTLSGLFAVFVFQKTENVKYVIAVYFFAFVVKFL